MSDGNTSWSQAFQRLITEPGREPERPKPFNPNPPGVVRRGSASHVIFEFLQECPARQFTAQEVIQATGLSRAAASFGLHYLSRNDLIDSIPDGLRNGRWLRYSARKSAQLRVSGDAAQPRDVRLVRRAKVMPETKGSCNPLLEGWYRDLPEFEEPRTVLDGGATTLHKGQQAWAQARTDSRGGCAPAKRDAAEAGNAGSDADLRRK